MLRSTAAPAAWLTHRYASLVLLTVALPFVVLAARPLAGDILWVLANGRFILDQGQLPTADPFTFAPHTTSYFDAQWLAQLAYIAAHRVLGLEGVAVFNAAVVSLSAALMLRAVWLRCRSLPAAAVSVLSGFAVSSWWFNPRAQTLALLPFSATVLLLSSRLTIIRLLGLGAAEAVWANLHGSFFLGPVLTLFALAGVAAPTLMRDRRLDLRALRPLLAGLAAQIAGSLLTPYGPSLYGYLKTISADPTIREHIIEWSPLALTDFSTGGFFVSVSVALLLVGRSWRFVPLADLLMLGVFGVLSLQAQRNVFWWGMASAPAVAIALRHAELPSWFTAHAAALLGSRFDARRALVRLGVIGAFVVAGTPWVRSALPVGPDQRGMIAADYPLAAADYLAAHDLGERVLSDHTWANYVDWQLWPRYSPMFDASIESHPTNVWRDAVAIYRGQARWEELADRYELDLFLLSVDSQGPLIEAIEQSPRWQTVYRDQQAVIFTRTATAHAGGAS